MRALSLVIIILVSVSCKCHSVVQRGSTVVQDSAMLLNVVRSVDTIVMRDSVYVREVMRGDTVYLTRTEWRDRWRTRVVHDTVRHTEYVDRVVEKPPERYVPKFYKRCTIALWAIIAAAIAYVLLRWWLRRRV